MNQPSSYSSQEPLYQTSYMGFYIKVYSNRVEFKSSAGSQSVPLNQIAGIQPGMMGLWQITLQTTSGANYPIPTTKKKEVEQAIRSAQANMPVNYQQPGYPMQQPYHQPVSAASQTKTYSSAKEFQRDQQRMARQGWVVQSTTSHQPRRSVGGLLFVPFAMWRPPKPQIIVTYQRTR